MAQLVTKFITNNAVTNPKLAQMAAHTFKGNNTGSTANPSDLTATQLTAELNLFTSTLQGLVPASGGGTTNFLRADGTFASPSGSGANTALSNLVTTSINQSLIPNTDNTFDLGSPLGTAAWAHLYAYLTITNSAISPTASSGTTTAFSAGSGQATATASSGSATFASGISANASGIANFVSGASQTGSGAVNVASGTANTGATGLVTIKSGIASSGASGNVLLQTGTATTTRGQIQFKDGTEGTAGYIWTSTDTLGSGNWAVNPGSGAITALTGDVTATGPGSAAATLATVNGNVGTFGSSTSIPTFTVNAKGLITAASGNAVIAPAGTLSGTTLNTTVVSSSLTSLGAQSQALNMNSHQINNVSDPTSAQDAATKNYVDNRVNGLSWKQYARAISTSPLPVNSYNNGASGVGATLTSTDGAFPAFAAVDGVTLSVNDRIIVAGEASGSHNGIYYLSQQGDTVSVPWVLTRSLDADTAAELVAAAAFVDEGTINATTAWVQSAPAPITVGTTALTFVKFSSTSTLNFRNGLLQTGSNVDVVPGDNSLTSTPGSLIVKLDAAGALTTGGSGVKVKVDAATVKINGSDNLESLKEEEQLITLSGTDITNQYVDLSFAVYGSSASINSVMLTVIGGPLQQKTVDYTVSLTGGSGGVTRISFAGDLSTGGPAALVAGDKLAIYYSYLT